MRTFRAEAVWFSVLLCCAPAAGLAQQAAKDYRRLVARTGMPLQ